MKDEKLAEDKTIPEKLPQKLESLKHSPPAGKDFSVAENSLSEKTFVFEANENAQEKVSFKFENGILAATLLSLM